MHLWMFGWLIVWLTGMTDEGAESEAKLEVGVTYMHGSTPYTIVGIGTEPFEYEATGESLELVIGTVPGTIVLVPEAGALVKVDPTVPMVWVNDEPHKEWETNSYLKKHGKAVRYILLEYQR